MIFPDKISTFSNRLNEMLIEKGLSQADLVRGSGIERSRISLYCSGRNDPKFEPVYRLALFLRVNPAWLMGYDVPKVVTGEKDYMSELNEDGRAKVEEYINDLLDNPKYKKSSDKPILFKTA